MHQRYFIATLVFVVLSSTLLALAQTGAPQVHRVRVDPALLTPSPSWARTPSPNPPPEDATVSPAVRQARDRVFNDKTGTRPRLDNAGDGPQVPDISGIYLVKIDALPVKLSDAVVVGSLTSYAAFLSGDHTVIYTELYVRIEQVFKDSTGLLHPGGLVTLPQMGGVLTMENGRVLRYPVTAGTHSLNDLEVNKKYTLFLTYASSLKVFSIIKTWELLETEVIPLLPADRDETDRSGGIYAMMNEYQFLTTLQRAVQENALKK